MKQFVIFVILVLISASSNAQDILTLKVGFRNNFSISGTRHEVFITEITPVLVWYRLFSATNEEKYYVYKDDVESIRFQDGRIVKFSETDVIITDAIDIAVSQQNKIEAGQTIVQNQERQQERVATNTQDIITMKDGHNINAFVREITATQVLFNLLIEPNGELYYVNKNDVSSILYRDGRTESFAVAYTETPEYRQSRTQTQPVTQSRQQQESVVYDKLNPYNQNNYLPAIRNTNREDFRRFNWGVKAGINIDESFYGRIYSFYASELINMNKKLGFHIGINARVMFTAKIGIESGLYFIQYGKQTSYYTHTIHTDCIIESTYNSFGFKFPITFLYKINVGHNFSIYPYLGYITNISRKISYSREYSNIVLGHPHNDYYDHMAIIPVDTGFTVGINLQFSKITTGFGYDIIIGGGETGNLAKLSVGYFFK